MRKAPVPCVKSRDAPAKGDRSPSLKAGRDIPVVHPFRERRLRSTAKEQNPKAFLAAFGRPDDPFPTLLAKTADLFSVWFPGKEAEGRIRRLTPLECERLHGAPGGLDKIWGRWKEDQRLRPASRARKRDRPALCGLHHGGHPGSAGRKEAKNDMWKANARLPTDGISWK